MGLFDTEVTAVMHIAQYKDPGVDPDLCRDALTPH